MKPKSTFLSFFPLPKCWMYSLKRICLFLFVFTNVRIPGHHLCRTDVIEIKSAFFLSNLIHCCHCCVNNRNPPCNNRCDIFCSNRQNPWPTMIIWSYISSFLLISPVSFDWHCPQLIVIHQVLLNQLYYCNWLSIWSTR